MRTRVRPNSPRQVLTKSNHWPSPKRKPMLSEFSNPIDPISIYTHQALRKPIYDVSHIEGIGAVEH